MSRRQGTFNSKSLKGNSIATANVIDNSLTATSTTGRSTALTGTFIENISIFSGTADDLTIGSAIPAPGSFSELTVGSEGGPSSGPVTFWGNSFSDYVSWRPEDNLFTINGGLTVRDDVNLGNIRISGNTIRAIAPIPNGDIILFPRGAGQVAIRGNIGHYSTGTALGDATPAGSINFNRTSTLSVVASQTAYIDGGTGARLSTRQGSVVVASDHGTLASIGITMVVSSPVGGNKVIIRTGDPHLLIAGDQVDVSGTNSQPSADGRFTVLDTPDSNSITVQLTYPITQNGSIAGTVRRGLYGTVDIRAGSAVNFNLGAPLVFGGTSRLQLLPTESNTFIVSADYLSIDDPIPQLRTPTGAFSDSGWEVSYRDNLTATNKRGFFGFQGDTTYFTWIPDATITRRPDGTKVVSGTKGIMNLEGLVLNKISGDPDLILEAPRDILMNAGRFVTIPNNIHFKVGNTSFRHNTSTVLFEVVTTADIFVAPTVAGKGVILSEGTPLSFNGLFRSQTITGTQGSGLTIASDGIINLSPPAQGSIKVPELVYLTFGTNPFQRIYANPSGLNFETPNNILLSPSLPNGSVRVPTNIPITFGGINDFIRGAGDGFGMTIQGSGALNLQSVGSVFLKPTGGLVESTGQYLRLPTIGNIQFGTSDNQSVRSSTGGVVSLNSTGTTGTVAVNATGNIGLNPGTSGQVTVPLNRRMTFGGRGTIYQDDTAFHVSTSGSDSLQLTAPITVVNGNFQVNGTTTYVRSETTEFTDPILHLAKLAPVTNVQDRGFIFTWSQGALPMKEGAVYWDQSAQEFVMASEVSNNNEILTAGQLGNLRIGNVTASSITTGQLALNTLVGTPDLFLVANGGSVYLQPTTSVVLTQGIPIVSGGNRIVGSAEGWTITGQNVMLPSGNFQLSNATFRMTDLNNLRIGGVQNVWMDSILYVASNIRFGTGQVQINVDAQQNLVLSTSSNILLTAPVQLSGSMTMGNSVLSWQNDSLGGKLVWANTNPTADLRLSIAGAIYDAEWRGKPIPTSSGGTGHLGAWIPGSVVFVEQLFSGEPFLSENNSQFFWEKTAGSLGIRTNTPQHALTLGSGSIDLMDQQGTMYFRHGGLYAYAIGKANSFNVLSLKAAAVPGSTTSSLGAVVCMTRYGHVGIGQTENYMALLTGAPTDARLYLNGGQLFTTFGTPMGWSATQYITGTSDGILHLYGASLIENHTSTRFSVDAQFLEATSRIYGTQGGKLHIASQNGTYFRSPHNVFVGRCCFIHDPITDTCNAWANGDTQSGNVDFTSNVGNYTFNPLTSVSIQGEKTLTFGSPSVIGSIGAVGNNLVVSGIAGNVSLVPLSSVTIPANKSLVFGGITSLVQNTTLGTFDVGSTTSVHFKVPSVVLPNGTPLVFGDPSRRIVSDGQYLTMKGSDEITLDCNVVRISGNLIVMGRTTQTIFTETAIESGVLQLGGGSLSNIVAMTNWGLAQTLVTVDKAHGLVMGNTVTLSNTNPPIDGTYVVAEAPTATTFVLPIVYPTIDTGSPIMGTVRSRLISNPNVDVGIQVNWHTGGVTGTSGARTGFFGLDRSTGRFTYFSNTTWAAGEFDPTGMGDAEFHAIYATNLVGRTSSGLTLGSPLSTGTFAVTGSNFRISGGSINATPIGAVTPSTGSFTDLTVSGNMIVSSTNPITNLNSDMVDGLHADDLLWRDGSKTLRSSWNAGGYRISSAELAATLLPSTRVVFVGSGGVLSTEDGFTFTGGNTLTTPQFGATRLVGTIDGNGQSISNATLVNGSVTGCDITLQQDDTLDATRGTVLFNTGQLFGGWIAGGTASIDITGRAGTVVNGVYTTNYLANSVLKADTVNNPVPLVVPPSTFIGRDATGGITALTPEQARNVMNVAEMGAENMYENGVVLRSGHLQYPDAGAMSGLFYYSFERVQMQSDQVITLSPDKQVTYISVNRSLAENMALANLPDGLSDGQVRMVVVTFLESNTFLTLKFKLRAPPPKLKINPPPSTGVLFDVSGQTIQLIWDNAVQTWFIMPTGAYTLTT